jgi:hypothetical protein
MLSAQIDDLATAKYIGNGRSTGIISTGISVDHDLLVLDEDEPVIGSRQLNTSTRRRAWLRDQSEMGGAEPQPR